MNVMASTYHLATRSDGLCHGTLWRTLCPTTSLSSSNSANESSYARTTDFGVLTGPCLDCYESPAAWHLRQAPLATYTIVGASAVSQDANEITFRLVTNQGTHLHCQAPSKTCRQVWLQALQAGLELSLAFANTETTTTLENPHPAPPQPSVFQRFSRQPHCRACNHKTTTSTTAAAGGAPSPTAASSSTTNTLSHHPLPEYGLESRVPLCSSCAQAQGLLAHVQRYRITLQQAQYSRQAFLQGRDLCFAAAARVTSSNNNVEAAAVPSDGDSESWSHVSQDPQASSRNSSSTSTSTTMSPSDPQQHHWQKVDLPPSLTSSPTHNTTSNWIDVPPSTELSKALWQVIEQTDFVSHTRHSPLLAHLVHQFQQGLLQETEFLAQLEADDAVAVAALKQQAFQLAGDMGSALQLLLDQTTTSSANAATTNGSSSASMQNNHHVSTEHNTDLLVCILDFLLNKCRDGETAAVAFFWPQLCHLHLRMLPPTTPSQTIKVELMEDFLLTVAARYSIQLALQLVWSHTADLEQGLQDESESTCAPRRFAILRFVCELESLLFDFDGGWGGGSVALGRLLQPTGHQVEWLKQQMQHIQVLRQALPVRLNQSARLDLLARSTSSLSANSSSNIPTLTADEKLRIAKNADYFSCHLIFTRRLSDIAEKLRFMDVSERADALREELTLLNASGTMGGDPLNRVREHLLHVVRVPNTEGHVFRSKERTPVLLLMEVIDEGAEVELEPFTEEEEEKEVTSSEEEKESSTKESDRESDTVAPSSGHPESEFDDSEHVKHPPKGALKRFDESESSHGEPTTPKRDVEKMVNSAAVQQLQELVLPDIEAGSNEEEDEAPAKTADSVDANDAKVEGAETEGNQEAQIAAAVPLPAEDSRDSSVEEKDEKDTTEAQNDEGENDTKDTTAKTEQERDAREGPSEKEAEGSQEVHVESVVRDVATLSIDAQQSEPVRGVAVRNSSSSILGNLKGNQTKPEDSNNTLAPTGDVRREVLNAIMIRGIEGNAIAAGTAISVQRSLQELERKRATELILQGEISNSSGTREGADGGKSEGSAVSSTRESLVALELSIKNDEETTAHTEEDEVMEAIRLLLIQNRVAQGKLSPADAAKVLQHASLNRVPSNSNVSLNDGEGGDDGEEVATVDAGDVDRRLVGCGPIPPAVLQALTLWKGGLVTNAELLELVKKDAAFVRHSVLLDAENVDKLNEDSAFWGRFAFGERWAEKKSRIASSSPQGASPGWDLMGVIVKSNDDLRQEAFVMQLIELCQEAFDIAGLELWVNPYKILATGRTTGVIEMVRNAMSFDALKKRPGYGKGGLREHLQRMTEFTVDPGEAFKSAQLNFVRSLAAYSLMSYLFMFKDRHNGNLLLDTAGHVIHIDFGFVFGIAPGGSFSLELSTPFKLTEEMLDVMGGLRSPLFSEFVTLFCCGFLALQSYKDTFLTIVEIMCEGSTYKCFEGKSSKEFLAQLTERFCPDKSKQETVSFALDLIKQATTSYGTRQYDIYQYLSQGIAA